MALEDQVRAETDFAALEPFEQRSGSNPHRVASLGGGRFAGVTRGGDQLLVLDSAGRAVASVEAPESPVDLAVRGAELWVTGEGSGAIGRYRVGDSASGEATLERLEPIAIDGALGLRAIAMDAAGTAYVAGEVTGAVWRRDQRGAVSELLRCHGPSQLAVVGDRLLVNCMLDHELRVWSLGDRPARLGAIRHDGPMWRFAAIADGDDLLVAVAGIEDRPLDRSVKGSFGYIDSFLFVYRVDPRGEATRLAAVNAGERGLITPKWIDLRLEGDGVVARASSYGGDKLITLRWGDRRAATWDAPEVDSADLPPGTTDIAWSGDVAIAADPLLDAWLVRGDEGWTAVPQAPADPRDVESRVGELLFFTKLMAPFGGTEGRKSRFTCEACHFEGYVDGRTHHTGRGDVAATSRSLRGLFNNRPHFSRALDKTTARMIDNEFRVANKLSGHDYWFALEAAAIPWLAHLDVPAALSPVFLRRSLMMFLRDFTNRRNPSTRGRDDYTDVERRGAELFRDRCERCHAARLIVDDPKSKVPFDRWREHIFSDAGAITWANADYYRTGVTPYVHELGARPASLRRLYKKWPYFTDGSAKSLAEVLERVRFQGKTLVHEGLTSGQALGPAEITALEAFLELL